MTKWGKLTIISTAILAIGMVLRMAWNIDNILILLTGILIGVCFVGAVVWWRDRNW
ncbi:MAG TPA: hypothetical protein VN379_15245 [Sporomusa sp.]|nr:hypothetical protein [Sporomusa sp.]